MKLLSLYIENFGGLSGYRISFDEGITVISEPNGFGKTTLAEFIRAMFYGFPRKAKTLDKSKRQKYAPWNGGQFGGNLSFELDGQCYRIERTFGATPRGDSFQLIDLSTGKKSTRFSEEIGLELFNLDSESFERSTYMPQLHDASSLTTNTIQAKLGDLVEDTNDINNFDKAMETMKGKRSTLIAYRGNGGAVAQAHGQISLLQQELEQVEGNKAALDRCAEQIADLENQRQSNEKELSLVREQIVRASEAAAAASLRQQHERIKLQHQQLQERLGSLQETVMAPDVLQKLAENNRELVRKQHELELLGDSREEAALSELEIVFASGMPTEDELAANRRHLERIRQLRQENILLAAAKTEEILTRKRNPVPGILLLVLGIIGITGGIVLLVQRSYWLGGIGLGIGIIGLIGAVFLCIRLMVSRELSGIPRVRPEQSRLDANEEEIRALEHLVRGFVRPYTGTESPADALRELERGREEYLSLRLKQAARKERQQLLEAEVSLLETELRTRLGDGDFEQRILQQRLAGEQCLELQQRLSALQQEKAAFEAEHGEKLSAPVQETGQDLARLQLRERQLTAESAELTGRALELRQQSRNLQAQIDRIPDILRELEQWQEKKAEGQNTARLLDDAMEFLEKARENLTNSYLGPIRSSFGGYMERLLGESAEKILITPDLDVRLERQGQARELGYFSAGQTDVVMLCMRLALVDALFTDVKPFVILDDPFVNLDDARTAEALKLLRELAKDRQILYLVCNSSRSL